jgi:hypothetical protein
MPFKRSMHAQASQEDAKSERCRASRGIADDTARIADQVVKGPMTAEAVEDASRAFKKALIERALPK